MLIDDPNRVDNTVAVGLDEVLFCRDGPFKHRLWSTQVVDDAVLASEFDAQLGIDLQDESCPPEVRRLGRTIIKWRHQIAAWHQAKFTNGPDRARQ